MKCKFILGAALFSQFFGCDQHLFTDYRPLDQLGMWSSSVEELKKLNTSDTEVMQLTKMKKAGISDDACVKVIADARQHQHPFSNADAAVNLTNASAEIGRLKNTGLTEGQIMERINRGMTDAEADKEAAYREATRNHANTGFTRVHGRRR
ncbi:MAG: hypothetical protein DMG42_36445 [Acidobacteria bacterium]|nr:MAG: hypothetical protein DMG42_36445 [Acidobacteriota bacterium]